MGCETLIPGSRAAALRLSERFLSTASTLLMEDYRRLATEGEGEVRLQLLLSLGQSTEGWATQLLADLLKGSAAWWNVAGAATALNGRELEFLNVILGRADWKQSTPGQIKLLEQLGWSMIHHPDAARVGLFLGLVSEQPRSDWRIAAVLRGALSAKRVGPATTLVTSPALLDSLKASADPEDLRLAEVLATHVVSGRDATVSKRAISPLSPAEESLFEVGRAQYALICAACHQANGQGLPGVAPSLVGSSWVTGPAEVPIWIVLQGLSGPIEVNGETWNMLMPGFGAAGGPLDDEKIAGVLTYIRRQWGNAAGAVTPAQVAEQRRATAARTVPWTAAELSTASGNAAGKN
jgi:mono/diheme cytochrome c family protein